MMSRNGQGGSGRTITQMPTSIRPKKKPAPPRPPQPKINRLQTSQSFNVGQELTSQVTGRPAGRDLIDFHTPPGSPNSGRRNTVCNISTARKDPNDFSYRVGASIFYIKSPLKHSVSEKPVQNPFSPPRPAAESIAQKPIAAGGNLQSSINAAWSSAKANHPTWDTPPATTQSSVPKTTAAQQGAKSTQHFQSSSLENNNSIKSNYPQASPWRPAGASSSSNASSDRTSNSFSDFSGSVSSQPRYSNIAEIQQQAGKKELSSTLSGGLGKKPTIIRPVNKLPSQASIEASSSTAQTAHAAVISALKNKVEKEEDDDKMQRNYYDLPPDDFDDAEDDLNDSSFISPPMPSEPPPPPPPDVLAVDEWVSSTTGVTDYPDTYSDAGQMTAYAIALYDFFPEKEGDLQLQAGDLVYLLRKIDDSWYQGSCGGMEGIFPSNFVNIMVPLPDEVMYEQSEEIGIYTEVLYDFDTETEGDLGLKAGEKVKLLGKINEDWLYGEKDGTKGQFPAIFVLPVVQDLPIIEA